MEKLNSQLLEAETELAETRLAMDQLKSKHEKLGREKGQIEGDNTALSRYNLLVVFILNLCSCLTYLLSVCLFVLSILRFSIDHTVRPTQKGVSCILTTCLI